MWICCWAIDNRWLCIQVRVVWRGPWVNFLNYQEPFSRTPPCFITAFSPLHPTELLCVPTHSAWGMLDLSFPFSTKQEDIGANARLLVRYQFKKKNKNASFTPFSHSLPLTFPALSWPAALQSLINPLPRLDCIQGTLCVYFKWLN